MFDEKNRFSFVVFVVGVLLLLVGGLDAIAQDAGEEGDATARMLVVRKVEGLLDNTASEQWDEAYHLIQPFLVDPEQSDVSVWRVAGRIALVEGDDELYI